VYRFRQLVLRDPQLVAVFPGVLAPVCTYPLPGQFLEPALRQGRDVGSGDVGSDPRHARMAVVTSGWRVLVPARYRRPLVRGAIGKKLCTVEVSSPARSAHEAVCTTRRNSVEDIGKGQEDLLIGKVMRVPLREVWKHEALDFTTWFQKNIDVVSDATNVPQDKAKREQPAGAVILTVRLVVLRSLSKHQARL
jgi:hypothetical protein